MGGGILHAREHRRTVHGKSAACVAAVQLLKRLRGRDEEEGGEDEKNVKELGETVCKAHAHRDPALGSAK